jgi:hypothetical protein
MLETYELVAEALAASKPVKDLENWYYVETRTRFNHSISQWYRDVRLIKDNLELNREETHRFNELARVNVD